MKRIKDLKDHEEIIIGSCLNYNPDGIEALQRLIAIKYKFTQPNFQEMAEYLFEATAKEGVTPNLVEFRSRFEFTEEQLKYIQHVGQQDAYPSEKFLRENKYITERLSTIASFAKRFEKEEVSEDDFLELENKLAVIEPLKHIKTQHEIDADILDEVKKKQDGKTITYFTGLKQLDNLMMGMDNESIIVGGGFSGSGKTNFAIQTALSVLKSNARVCYISAENSEMQLKIRFGSHEAKVMQAAIRLPSHQDHIPLLKGISDITKKYGDNLILLKISDFDEALQYMKLLTITDRVDFFILDYIQLFSTKRKGMQEERVRLEDFTTRLMEYSIHYRKPIYVVAQTTEGASYSFKGSQSIRNMATDGFIIFRSSNPEYGTDPLHPARKIKKFRVMVDLIKARNSLEGKCYCEVVPNDPTLRDANIDYTDIEAIKEWQKLANQRTMRY